MGETSEWETAFWATSAAEVAFERGRLDEALAKYADAEGRIRNFMADSVSEPRLARELGRLLYGKAALLTSLKRLVEAVAALEETENIYLSLRESDEPKVERLIADVRARRGRANGLRGFGVTAVHEIGLAVDTYVALVEKAGDGRSELELALARVLSLNAVHGQYCLDPDLAVASADVAMRIYAAHAVEISAGPRALMHTQYSWNAAAAQATLHSARGHFELALRGADAAVEAARTRLRMGETSATEALCLSLAEKAIHLRALDRLDEAGSVRKEAVGMNAALVASRENAFEAREQQGWAHNTLARALELAASTLGPERVPYSFADALVEKSGSRRVFTPFGRCEPELGALLGEELAGMAAELMRRQPDTAFRLGIEAHYLWTAASRQHGSALENVEYAPTWAHTVMALSQQHLELDFPLALDLSSWAVAAARLLIPLLDTREHSRLKPVVLEIMHYRLGLLTAAEDSAATEQRKELERVRAL